MLSWLPCQMPGVIEEVLRLADPVRTNWICNFCLCVAAHKIVKFFCPTDIFTDCWDIRLVCWFIACLMSQQHASVSQGWICSENCAWCHTETEAADLALSPYQNILIAPQPALPLTLKHQAPGRVTTTAPALQSLVWLDPQTAQHRKRYSNPGMPLFRWTPYQQAKAVGH